MIRLLEASNEKSTMWHWSDSAKLLALTDHTQVLSVLTVDGKRADIPPLTLYSDLATEVLGGCHPVSRRLRP